MADLPERIYANDANHWHPFPGEEGTVEYVRADIYANGLARLAIESNARELALAALECDVIAIRAALAMSDQPCVYCSLPASEMNRCELGFPGCDRADDALGCPHLGASLRVEFLEKALEQALMYEQWVYSDERRCPELAQYLQEKNEG